MIPQVPVITGLKTGGILVGEVALTSRIKGESFADYPATA
jgi:hypothetical protein